MLSIPSASNSCNNEKNEQCSGAQPCEQCEMRNIHCVYDLAADRRRKIASKRMIQEMAQQAEDIERYRVLLRGLFATVRAGNGNTINELIHTIGNCGGFADLALHIDGVMTTWPAVYQEFQQIDFDLDQSPRLPSVEDLGSRADKVASTGAGEHGGNENQDQDRVCLTPERLQYAGKSGRSRYVIARDTNERHESLGNKPDGGTSIQVSRPWELP